MKLAIIPKFTYSISTTKLSH